MNHSYEELRAAALDVLAGREKGPYEPSQYESLSIGVAEAFLRREDPQAQPPHSRRPAYLSGADRELFLEVFWDLFRQGIITLGLNDNNREFPFFRLSRLGQRLIANQDTYFFLYVQEALQAFRAGCILSSTVMLGVATEHTFLLLAEAVDQSPTHAKHFAGVAKERTHPFRGYPFGHPNLSQPGRASNGPHSRPRADLRAPSVVRALLPEDVPASRPPEEIAMRPGGLTTNEADKVHDAAAGAAFCSLPRCSADMRGAEELRRDRS